MSTEINSKYLQANKLCMAELLPYALPTCMSELNNQEVLKTIINILNVCFKTYLTKPTLHTKLQNPQSDGFKPVRILLCVNL